MKTHRALLNDINQCQLQPHQLAFWWLGQMSYVVKIGAKVLYFDPYLAPRETRQIPPMFAPEEVTNADYVFGSHPHDDHIDLFALPGIAKASPHAKFACSRVTRSSVREPGISEDRILGCDEGLVYEEDGLNIQAIAAQHEFFDRDPELGYPYLSWIVRYQGITIFHAGDTLKYDGICAKLAKYPIDIAFLPINGRDAERLARGCIGNMTYQEAVDLAGDIRPRLTVPGHYDMFTDNSEDPTKFARYMSVKFPDLAYWIGEHGTAVIVDCEK